MPIFVIHHHFASHEHYDLRLSLGGVLRSWAVPKEPPKRTGVKRLAVQVDDHPLPYATFAGTIPKGHYGAGKVEIWDKGTYELIDRDEKKIVFTLKGKKLKGAYVLLKFQGESWLFFRRRQDIPKRRPHRNPIRQGRLRAFARASPLRRSIWLT